MSVLEDVMMNEVHAFETDEYHDSGGSGNGIHAGTGRHANGRGDPKACGCGQSFHYIFLKDDGSGTNEAYAADHLSGHTSRVALDDDTGLAHEVVEAIHGKNHIQSASEAYEEVGAKAGLLRSVLAFKSDGTAQHGGNEDT